MNISRRLIKIANKLDSLGLYKDASVIDDISKEFIKLAARSRLIQRIFIETLRKYPEYKTQSQGVNIKKFRDNLKGVYEKIESEIASDPGINTDPVPLIVAKLQEYDSTIRKILSQKSFRSLTKNEIKRLKGMTRGQAFDIIHRYNVSIKNTSGAGRFALPIDRKSRDPKTGKPIPALRRDKDSVVRIWRMQ